MAFKPTELIINPECDELILTYSNNFSYNTVPYGCCLRIHVYQEMLVYDDLEIDGDIIIDGDLAFIN